jgi:hypothetical protein
MRLCAPSVQPSRNCRICNCRLLSSTNLEPKRTDRKYRVAFASPNPKISRIDYLITYKLLTAYKFLLRSAS